MRLRVLAMAAATQRVGAVFLIDGEVKFWRMSQEAAISTEQAQKWARKLIHDLQPDLMVLEERGDKCRKGANTREILDAIAFVAGELDVMLTEVEHKQRYKNKYIEAEALVEQFPELTQWLPEHPKIWKSEPRETILFEALAMTADVLNERVA